MRTSGFDAPECTITRAEYYRIRGAPALVSVPPIVAEVVRLCEHCGVALRPDRPACQRWCSRSCSARRRSRP